MKKTIVLIKNGIIGRNEQSDYYLPYQSVSRNHCEIILEGSITRIKDIESKNGTIVNNIRVNEAVLSEGDIVQIGELYFKVGKSNSYHVLNPFKNKAKYSSPQPARNDTVVIQSSDAQLKESPGIYHAREQDSISVGKDSRNIAVKSAKSILVSPETTFAQALNEFRRKLGSDALFLIELSATGTVIRAESVSGKYILSKAVLNHLRDRISAYSILEDTPDNQKARETIAGIFNRKGIWAPKELKCSSQSLLGAAECSVYCAPLWDYEENEILLYAYWRDGCSSPKYVEELIAAEGEKIFPVADDSWAESATRYAQKRMLSELSEPLVGKSPAFLNVIEHMAKLAATDFSIVLLGPRGCGKTTIAHAIHEMSLRKNGPFKAFNCANFQINLVESELFGSKRGAYTDAVDRKGYLLEADGGTILIDSVESCPMEVQAKLRDVLEGRPFRAVGSDKEQRVDVRFIAALNEDPDYLQKDNRLRLDFWDRISVQFIEIPPLWHRLSDIPELAFYFLHREQKKCPNSCTLKGFTPEAFTALQSYYWPGNIRELCNVISRLIVYSQNDMATAEDIQQAITTLLHSNDYSIMKSIFDLPYKEAIRIFESIYFQKKLTESNNNKSKAAALAKLSRKVLYKFLRKTKL